MPLLRRAVRVKGPDSVLVVTSCSALKAYSGPALPAFDDLVSPERRKEVFTRLALQVMPAREMYRGRHHLSVIGDVDRLRRVFADQRVDLAIVSAGFGLLEEWEPIIPYKATFSALSSRGACERARQLAIRRKLEDRLRVYDVTIFLLSSVYLNAIEAPIGSESLEVYFRSSPLPNPPDGVLQVNAGLEESRRLGVAPRVVAATLFNRFTSVVIECGWLKALERLTIPEVLLPPLTNLD